MDQIRLTGIRATGKHGVLDFEHERAQTFVVDATLFLDLAAAGRSDDLNDTVDYGAVAKGIVAIIEGEHVDLIEKLANRIVGMILGFPAVCRTQVTVHKPNAPITVPFDDVSVTVERSRETVDSPSRERSSEHGQVHHAIIAMGGNQGDVTATLRDAVRCIDGLPSTQVTGVSPLYRTDAWGMPEGTAEFRNAVVSVDTRLSAAELLAGLQRIEASHGRVRTDHWTSRTLDLDIIDFDGQESADPDLTLPHPRAWQRAFVLGPWLALEPDAELGGAHAGSVAQLLHETSDRDHIDEIADDWMVAGAQDPIVRDSDIGTSADDVDAIDDADSVESIDSIELPEGTAASKAAAAAAAKPGPASRRAVISLDSVSTDAEHQFRQAWKVFRRCTMSARSTTIRTKWPPSCRFPRAWTRVSLSVRWNRCHPPFRMTSTSTLWTWKAWSATNLIAWCRGRPHVSMRPCSPHGSTWIRTRNSAGIRSRSCWRWLRTPRKWAC